MDLFKRAEKQLEQKPLDLVNDNLTEGNLNIILIVKGTEKFLLMSSKENTTTITSTFVSNF